MLTVFIVINGYNYEINLSKLNIYMNACVFYACVNFNAINETLQNKYESIGRVEFTCSSHRVFLELILSVNVVLKNEPHTLTDDAKAKQNEM